jgi:hypothetical protein
MMEAGLIGVEMMAHRLWQTDRRIVYSLAFKLHPIVHGAEN